MTALIVLGVVVTLAFATLFMVHHRKVQEEKRVQMERKIREFETQAKRIEPLVTRIRPHLLPYDLRSALAERWISILHAQQDAGDKREEFLAYVSEAETKVREVKANPNPTPQPIENQQKGQEAMNQLKNVQFLIMKEFREGKLSETKGQEFLSALRHAATQVVVEMNKSMAEEQLQNKKYRAAIIYYQNILKELKKYRGTDQAQFSNVFNEVRTAMERIKPLAQQELKSGPNMLAEGMDELEEEENFMSDVQRAVMASKAKARSQRG
ncbi:hypothetical protein [Marinospirillum alkaliphilum]|uniref:Uncharacterized protein n=1 Tax=Marinospirillum alkaliphilum DSM 21637 TaxID=1122209 RepID=A0A1K1YUC7_9GAMM|nr:hypothetical protein [Marinospirillum alkaliphilum]SFX65618.1 hypothetical protein SAMN02745752_02391 [Marinospirillum alkaliphilum DSM 21637]